VVGYTQRFRRKWLAGKEKVRSGALGDVTMVSSRAFMNRLVAIVNGAVKQQKIDSDTVNSLISVGHQDADLCWTSTDKCSSDAAQRAEDKSFDIDKNQTMLNNCQFPTDAVCKRVEKCN